MKVSHCDMTAPNKTYSYTGMCLARL